MTVPGTPVSVPPPPAAPPPTAVAPPPPPQDDMMVAEDDEYYDPAVDPGTVDDLAPEEFECPH